MRYFLFFFLYVGNLFAQDSQFLSFVQTDNHLNEIKNTLLDSKLYDLEQWRALLHYDGEKSSVQKNSNFFLTTNGYKNPKDEYIATIERLFDELVSKPNDDSIICQYPARISFIANFVQSEEFKNRIDISQCQKLQEFFNIVPIERIFIEFAAESDIYPGSSMGHIYLHLQGRVKNDIQKSIDGVDLNFKKGEIQDYAIGYIALLNENFNPIDYLQAISGSLSGFYTLSPYSNTEFEYLENERRSIYVYELQISKEQIEFFALHLWELKDKKIAYAFITHNCTNGIERILGVLNSQYFFKGSKPFITPVEYLQYLDSKISFIQIKAPPNKQNYITRFGANNILQARKSSKIAFGLINSHNQLWSGFLYFSPIYSDIKNVSNAYNEIIESRLLSLEAHINKTPYNTNISLHKIELLHLFSVADSLSTGGFSKLVSLRLEPNVYQILKGKEFGISNNTHTRLFPSVDVGVGFGAYTGNFSVYCMPQVGYRYEIIHNPYVGLKSGFVWQFPRFKFLADYRLFYDIVGNNRGYDSAINAYVGMNIYNQMDLFMEFYVFNNLFTNAQISYQGNFLMNLKFGVSINF